MGSQRAPRRSMPAAVAPLADAAGLLATRGLGALPEALARFTAALHLSDILLRTPDRAATLARAQHGPVPAQASGRTYVLDVPVRRLTDLSGVLTVTATRPLTAADASLVSGLASVLALALAVDPAAPAWSAARSILDEEADRAQAAATLYGGLGEALVAIRYAADQVSSGNAGPRLLDEPIRVALAILRHTQIDGRAHALEAGLRAALRQLPDQFAGDRLDDGMPELRVSVTADDPELDEVPPHIAVVVQRVAEAVLRGSVAHANLRATSNGLRVKLWVESAEIAYDASELNRWSRRASALGGDLVVQPGGVVLELPLLPGTTA